MQFVYDSLNGNFDNYTVDELIQETEEYYPELLEDHGDLDTPMAEEVYAE